MVLDEDDRDLGFGDRQKQIVLAFNGAREKPKSTV
jgi:hypothetical protein